MSRIKFFALGGLDEKNKNLYCLEIDSKIFILDSGIYEPLKDDFGIHHLSAKIDYLKENKDKIKAVFYSSPNKIQFGFISDLVNEFPRIQIYGSEPTIELIKLNYENQSKNWNLNILQPYTTIEISGIKISTISLVSSMPGVLGYVFHTPDGNIIYLNDYIIDVIEEYYSPEKPIGNDFNKLIGQKNLLLLNDSLNASIESSISSWYKITKYIEPHLNKSNRVIASIYEDEIINIVELCELALKYSKKIYFYDKLMFDFFKFLISKKYIKPYKVGLFEENISKENTILIVTASRTVLYTKLQNIITNESEVMLDENDIMFLASTPQPGNEHIYAEIANDLMRVDPHIVEIPMKEKFSFHPTKFDIRNILVLIKPKYFIPVRGYFKEFESSKEVALSLGMDQSNIIISEIGETFLIENGNLNKEIYKIKEVGYSIIQQGNNMGIEVETITERESLAKDGVITISFLLNKDNKNIISNIDIQMKGVIFLRKQETLLSTINTKIIDSINETKENQEQKWSINNLKTKLLKEIGKILRQLIKKSPNILISAIEI